MGWIWKDDEDEQFNGSNSCNIANFRNPSSEYSDDYCSTRKIVQSNCNIEEVEPGKFVRKCEKTEQILRDCVGKPTEVVQSNKEYTEEDVTNEVKKGSSAMSSDMRPFDFPGFQSDIEAIERSVFGGISRFFEAADEMRNEFSRFIDDSSVFGQFPSSSGRRQDISIEGHLKKEPKTIPNNSECGDVDLSGLARDV